MSDRTVCIVGGGIAGITAAVKCADRGMRVTLLETRKRLGGRATSFTDPRTGETLDNCQHVALRCCAAYRSLCERLGVDQLLRWDDTQTWIESGGRITRLRPSALPAPLHFAPAFAAARFLTLREKLAVARAMQRIRGVDRGRFADQTFLNVLRTWKQPEGAIRKFWEPVIVGACNAPTDRVAATAALYVFQEGFLSARDAGTIGISTVPLVRLYDRAEEVIRAAGGQVCLGASVSRVDAKTAMLADGTRVEADRVVCALPFERALKAVGDSVQRQDPRFEAMRVLEHSPILGVHLEFDRPILADPAPLDAHHVVLVDRPTHWLFRKDPPPSGGKTASDPQSGQGYGRRLHAVVSAAFDWVGMDEDEIIAAIRADMDACLPWSRGAGLVSARAVKEKRATFIPTPAAEAARRSITPDGPSGVVLAGDFTDTGWPATMEGATRSGAAAAGVL